MVLAKAWKRRDYLLFDLHTETITEIPSLQGMGLQSAAELKAPSDLSLSHNHLPFLLPQTVSLPIQLATFPKGLNYAT